MQEFTEEFRSLSQLPIEFQLNITRRKEEEYCLQFTCLSSWEFMNVKLLHKPIAPGANGGCSNFKITSIYVHFYRIRDAGDSKF